MERETTYIYVCWQFVTCFSGSRLTASMSSTIKHLNNCLRLIAYSDCSIAPVSRNTAPAHEIRLSAIRKDRVVGVLRNYDVV